MSKINAFGPVNGYNGYMFAYLYKKLIMPEILNIDA